MISSALEFILFIYFISKERFMKKLTSPNYLALLVTFLISISFNTLAKQPKAEDLVGKVYGGIHAMHIEIDDELLLTTNPQSTLDSGNGFGIEAGYRWLPSMEFRLSRSQFNTDASYQGYPEPDSSATSIDLLFFPSEKNFYLLSGINQLDIKSVETAANIGAGYRHYISDRIGLYLETKAHYELSTKHKDFTAQLGLVYFFGNNNSPKPVALDTDKDGVTDKKDRCKNSPIIDKVDNTGCTIFIDDEVSVELLVQFDNNKAIIKAEYYQKIKEMAEFLIANPSTSITIEGHTSILGSAAHNKALSQLRADAIVDKLSSDYNIDNSRLTAIGFGEEQLLNTSTAKSAHAENRRIIAKVKTHRKKAVKR